MTSSTAAEVAEVVLTDSQIQELPQVQVATALYGLHHGVLGEDQRRDIFPALTLALLNAPLRARIGDLAVVHHGWSKTAADLADSIAEPGTLRWRAALGTPSEVTLTGDGRMVSVRGRIPFCGCDPRPDSDTEIRYERWTVRGREAHGFCCPTCRYLTQTG